MRVLIIAFVLGCLVPSGALAQDGAPEVVEPPQAESPPPISPLAEELADAPEPTGKAAATVDELPPPPPAPGWFTKVAPAALLPMAMLGTALAGTAALVALCVPVAFGGLSIALNARSLPDAARYALFSIYVYAPLGLGLAGFLMPVAALVTAIASPFLAWAGAAVAMRKTGWSFPWWVAPAVVTPLVAAALVAGFVLGMVALAGAAAGFVATVILGILTMAGGNPLPVAIALVGTGGSALVLALLSIASAPLAMALVGHLGGALAVAKAAERTATLDKPDVDAEQADAPSGPDTQLQ